MRIVFIGDIVGENAVDFVVDQISFLRKNYRPDFIVANVENAQNGKGINVDLFGKLSRSGVMAMTSGNHIWDIRNRKVLEDERINQTLIRPLNYPDGLPGKGIQFYRLENDEVAVVNLQGQTFMESIHSPFETLEKHIIGIRSRTKKIIVDFHGEATSEKKAFAHYFDGRVSVVIGTHTHVPTADEQVFPGGTGFISDAGMTGPVNSVLGMEIQQATDRFIKKIPNHYKLAKGPIALHGVMVELDSQTGKCLEIKRIKVE